MKPRITRIFISILFVALVQSAFAQAPLVRPESVSLASGRLAQMDAVITEEIAKEKLPGAVVLVGRKGSVVWRKAYGARALDPAREPMTPDTIFDLASLTKVVATATSIMILVERGKLRFNDPVSLHIPELKGEGRDRITIEQLLTHVSGYAPDFDLRERWTGYDEAIKRLIKEPLRNPPGSRFTYSDIGFITLGEVVARVGGMPLDQFARKTFLDHCTCRIPAFARALR
jgi:CubicO group peptidase (beta-lactamase class C family)